MPSARKQQANLQVSTRASAQHATAIPDTPPGVGLSREVKTVAAVVVLGVIMSALTRRSSTSLWTRCRAICTRR